MADSKQQQQLNGYVTALQLDQLISKYGAIAGPAGKDGRDGRAGAEGPRGGEGPRGKTGDKGEQGERGSQGFRGYPGADGKHGCDGKPGRDGCDGRDGDTGATGKQGPAGPAGKDGLDGKMGPAGPEGKDGAPGAKGDPGPQGIQGPVGLQGPKGDTGPQGIQGATGPQGEQGQQGDKGDTGLTGPAGKDGPAGATGAPGTNGTNGTNGTIVACIETDTEVTFTFDNGLGPVPGCTVSKDGNSTDTNFYTTAVETIVSAEGIRSQIQLNNGTVVTGNLIGWQALAQGIEPFLNMPSYCLSDISQTVVNGELTTQITQANCAPVSNTVTLPTGGTGGTEGTTDCVTSITGTLQDNNTRLRLQWQQDNCAGGESLVDVTPLLGGGAGTTSVITRANNCYEDIVVDGNVIGTYVPAPPEECHGQCIYNFNGQITMTVVTSDGSAFRYRFDEAQPYASLASGQTAVYNYDDQGYPDGYTGKIQVCVDRCVDIVSWNFTGISQEQLESC